MKEGVAVLISLLLFLGGLTAFRYAIETKSKMDRALVEEQSIRDAITTFNKNETVNKEITGVDAFNALAASVYNGDYVEVVTGSVVTDTNGYASMSDMDKKIRRDEIIEGPTDINKYDYSVDINSRPVKYVFIKK